MPAKGTYKIEVQLDGAVLVNGRVPRMWENSNGYLTFKCGRRPHVVHREVAKVLIPNPDGLSDVNHKDGDKYNNHPSNLEWVSRRENIMHSLRSGLHANPERMVRAVHEQTGEVLIFNSTAEAGRNGFSQPNVSKCLNGERQRHKGYRWYFHTE